MKYVAKLEDGTVVSKSPDEGSQYFIKDGMLHSESSHNRLFSILWSIPGLGLASLPNLKRVSRTCLLRYLLETNEVLDFLKWTAESETHK